jgi:hypothetical protein
MTTSSSQPTPAGTDRSAPQLLQLRVDRRLGHEWDDWDGEPLANDGIFQEGPTLFFGLAALLGLCLTLGTVAVVWLLAPRLSTLWAPLPAVATWTVGIVSLLFGLWLATVAYVLRTGRNVLPERLAERGLLPTLMPWLERVGVWFGLSRDRVGNSLMRVFNGLASGRARPGIKPDDLLVLLPRCLGKDAMQGAMAIAGRYGVPLFVASRGRYARQMIGMRRPQRIVAVACERDLVSGVGDVGAHLPVLGTTLGLPDGPCKNTQVDLPTLEAQIRTFLGLEASAASH